MAQIIDGKKISQDIKDELKEKVTALKDTGTEVALAAVSYTHLTLPTNREV